MVHRAAGDFGDDVTASEVGAREDSTSIPRCLDHDARHVVRNSSFRAGELRFLLSAEIGDGIEDTLRHLFDDH